MDRIPCRKLHRHPCILVMMAFILPALITLAGFIQYFFVPSYQYRLHSYPPLSPILINTAKYKLDHPFFIRPNFPFYDVYSCNSLPKTNPSLVYTSTVDTYVNRWYRQFTFRLSEIVPYSVSVSLPSPLCKKELLDNIASNLRLSIIIDHKTTSVVLSTLTPTSTSDSCVFTIPPESTPACPLGANCTAILEFTGTSFPLGVQTTSIRVMLAVAFTQMQTADCTLVVGQKLLTSALLTQELPFSLNSVFNYPETTNITAIPPYILLSPKRTKETIPYMRSWGMSSANDVTLTFIGTINGLTNFGMMFGFSLTILILTLLVVFTFIYKRDIPYWKQYLRSYLMKVEAQQAASVSSEEEGEDESLSDDKTDEGDKLLPENE